MNINNQNIPCTKVCKALKLLYESFSSFNAFSFRTEASARSAPRVWDPRAPFGHHIMSRKRHPTMT